MRFNYSCWISPDQPVYVVSAYVFMCWIVLALLGCNGPDRSGRKRADDAWEKGVAVIYDEGFCRYSSIDENGLDVYYDMETGLGLHPSHTTGRGARPIAFYNSYNSRVRELVRDYGIPSWSMKKYLIQLTEVAAKIQDIPLPEIKSFPNRPNENILLLKQGTFSFGNRSVTVRGSGDRISIATPTSLISPNEDGPVFGGILTSYPHFVVIRFAERKAYVFAATGQKLGIVYLRSSVSSKNSSAFPPSTVVTQPESTAGQEE